jgi:5'-methylthioadenosine phosphorylase
MPFYQGEKLMPKVGVVAGSGFYEFQGVAVTGTRIIKTPYGEPSDAFRVCEVPGAEFVFLSRHGTPHHIPPHTINYRANIWGFREMGVERIISVNAVGGISPSIKPGDVVIPDQIIDMTHGRAATFYDGDEVVHIDFTSPYCPELRESILEAGKKSGKAPGESGTYICVNGPRLESKAEIGYFSRIGGEVVGMTVMPEACLARELELCYAGIAVVTNYAAGIAAKKLTTSEVVDVMEASAERIRSLVIDTLERVPAKKKCGCGEALKESRM